METTLTKFMSDLLSTADSDNVSMLALLNLSAAFDTVDYSVLL